MKRTAILGMLLGTLLLTTPQDLWARGGRGGGGGGGFRGGGGGGGGMSRPSPAAGRSPSMGGYHGQSGMRPASGTARPQGGPRPGGQPSASPGNTARAGAGARPADGGARPGGRPTAGQLDNFLNVPNPSRGAGGVAERRSGEGGPAADFLRDSSPGARAGIAAEGRPGVAGQRAAVNGRLGEAANREGRVASNRPDRIQDRGERQGNRDQRRDQVRDQVADNHPRLDFWSDHPNWASWRINTPYRWATWGALAGWVGYGASEPAAYDYGENVYYEGDQVYSGDQAVATTEEYADQAATIAESAPEQPPQDSEWMPLGVFAVTQDGQASGSDPNLFMQLAISKEGILSGTFKNMVTGTVQDLEGMVDKTSQRAAWGVKGQERPIIETGLGNLTKDTAPVLIHFADGQTQQWLLVRLNDPAQNQQPAPGQ